nr:60S ribosomal protein L37a-like [Desmodus rotundus]
MTTAGKAPGAYGEKLKETTKRTKKVRIVGKESTHYGTALRKTVKKTEISHHTKYTCSFCGKTKMKRRAVGTWHCGSCVKMAAGGAWTHSPTSAVMATSAIRRLKGPKDQEELHSERRLVPSEKSELHW